MEDKYALILNKIEGSDKVLKEINYDVSTLNLMVNFHSQFDMTSHSVSIK